MTELKSCPFCGDDYITVNKNYPDDLYSCKVTYRIGCQTCNCFGCHAYSRIFKSKEEAIAAWNRRINDVE